MTRNPEAGTRRWARRARRFAPLAMVVAMIGLGALGIARTYSIHIQRAEYAEAERKRRYALDQAKESVNRELEETQIKFAEIKREVSALLKKGRESDLHP